ncbi:MAG: hypothetical protein WD847_05195 [Pirellulales bacterium]
MNANRSTVLVIMLALLAWGAFLAIGAYRFNHNPLRSLVVMGCVLGFLAFWKLMLVSRQARLARRDGIRRG